MRSKSALVPLAVLALLGSCASDPPEREPSIASAIPAAARPWTRRFHEESVLFAAEVEIVGPIGLREHLVVAQDPETSEHVETTTPEGYRIVQRRKPDADDAPIRAHLDALAIFADQSLSVLESSNASDVVVSARGEVFFRVTKSGEETRTSSLRLVGTP